jgi:hypothetical protein
MSGVKKERNCILKKGDRKFLTQTYVKHIRKKQFLKRLDVKSG